MLEDNKEKREAVAQNKIAYYDHNGIYRLVKDDSHVIYVKQPNGERVLKDFRTNKIVHNFDADRKQKALEEENEKVKRENKDIELLGKFEDIFPNKVRNGIWFHTSGKEAVYRYIPDNKCYFREKWGDIIVYIDIETGFRCILGQQNPSEYVKQAIDSNNSFYREHENLPVILSDRKSIFVI